MNKCKDCKYWVKHDNGFYNLGYGSCKSVMFVEGTTGSSPPDIRLDGFYYWDCEGFSAAFETGQNFGCVHWKKA